MLQFPNPSGKKWTHKSIQVAQRKRKTTRVRRELAELTMADPFPRIEDEITYVIVERTIRKRVPDFEAEVLTRNGWKEITE